MRARALSSTRIFKNLPMGFGVGRGGGHLGHAAKSKEVARDLGLERKASFRDWLHLMKPYFLPRTAKHRMSAVACYSCLGLSKLTSIAGPAYMGMATDGIVKGELPVRAILMFTILRFVSSVCDESQRLLYLRVKEVAALELDCLSFEHLHNLSYAWHVGKRSGVVLQAMSRGSKAASDVVEMLFLRLVPTIAEMLVLVVIFAARYGSWRSSLVLLASFLFYFGLTYKLTNRRTKEHAKANLAGDDAISIASDSLTGFEVVVHHVCLVYHSSTT